MKTMAVPPADRARRLGPGPKTRAHSITDRIIGLNRSCFPRRGFKAPRMSMAAPDTARALIYQTKRDRTRALESMTTKDSNIVRDPTQLAALGREGDRSQSR